MKWCSAYVKAVRLDPDCIKDVITIPDIGIPIVKISETCKVE